MHAVKGVCHSLYHRIMANKDEMTGPRGGKTTFTPGGLLKKTIYFEPEEWEALRERSYREQRPISELIRSLIRKGLALDSE